MELLAALLIAVAASTAVPRGRARWAFLAATALAVGGLAAVRPTPPPDHDHLRPADATAAPDADHVSSRACRSCHPGAYASWSRTFHRRMTQAVTPETVLAAFDGRTLYDGPRRYRVYRDGDRFMVDMPRWGTNGETPAERMIKPVVMSTGAHHMQAYWVPSPEAEGPPARVGRTLFNQRCTTCHGQNGGARDQIASLRDGMRLPHEIAATLRTPPHAGLVDGVEAEEITRFVVRLQATGGLMQFPFVWLVRQERWAHEEFTFLQPESPPEPFEPWGDTWSDACDQCHSVRPGADWSVLTQQTDAEVAELGIACEACHGPGRAHVARHADPIDRYGGHLRGAPPEDDIVQPADLDHRRASAVCAQCHAEMVLVDPDQRFRPGMELGAHADVVQYTPTDPPAWLKPVLEDEPDLLTDAFWTDGTIRIAGRNYNAQALSGCYTRGTMSCLTCHAMHEGDPADQLKWPADDDTPCLSCHGDIGRDIESHTHHPKASTGSRCNNCHMPHTTVGLLTLMRSHRLDSPSAVTSAWTGRPNACSLCHLDKTLADVAETLTRWYGHEPLPEVADDRGASAVVAWALRGDAVQRAAAAWHMGWAPALAVSGDDWQVPFLAILLDDPYAAVRAIAHDALKAQPGFAGFEYDYIGPPAARRAAAQRALDQWQRDVQPIDRPSAFIVDGRLDSKSIEVLVERRDDTEVRVNE